MEGAPGVASTALADIKGWLVVLITTGVAALVVPVTPGTTHGRLGHWVRQASLVMMGVSALAIIFTLFQR